MSREQGGVHLPRLRLPTARPRSNDLQTYRPLGEEFAGFLTSDRQGPYSGPPVGPIGAARGPWPGNWYRERVGQSLAFGGVSPTRTSPHDDMTIDNIPNANFGASARSLAAPSLIATGSLASDYLNLLKASLTATVHQDAYIAPPSYAGASRRVNRWTVGALTRALRSRDWEIVRRCPRDALVDGRAWPLTGETMIGLARLENLQSCIEQIVRSSVPGDLIETGTWRGGASIFMRGVLRALEVNDRRVWVADSFRGLPEPDERFPADTSDQHHGFTELAISLDVVQENFRRYGLLDEQVRFLEGWFSETLPTVADVRWSLIRLDGDMYESTLDALQNLYPQLSPGGFVVVDDGALAPCRQAVDDFRARHGITDPIQWIDWTGFFWQRGGR